MIDPKDLYLNQNVAPLNSTDEHDATTQHGKTVINYEIRRYRDVMNLGNQLAYQVTCTQRVVIPNGIFSVPTSDNICANYPAIVTNQIQLSSVPSGKHWIMDYTPSTLNSSTSQNASQNGSQSSAREGAELSARGAGRREPRPFPWEGVAGSS